MASSKATGSKRARRSIETVTASAVRELGEVAREHGFGRPQTILVGVAQVDRKGGPVTG